MDVPDWIGDRLIFAAVFLGGIALLNALRSGSSKPATSANKVEESFDREVLWSGLWVVSVLAILATLLRIGWKVAGWAWR
jgi:hypothetical protein